MFNVMLRTTFVLHEALLEVSGKHESMRKAWAKLAEDLAAARASLESEKERRVATGEQLAQRCRSSGKR